MDQGTQRQSLERICRLVGNRLPERDSLSAPGLTPDQARAWARYAETSPLYQHLTEVVASSEQLMDVLNSIEHLPRHNMLFAGVQYLMLRDGGGPLSEFYPNLAHEPRDISGVDADFTTFVVDHANELAEIGRTRYTQTNECRRCVALLPGIWATSAVRFHLVDFGTSAGLNLQLGRYTYRWGHVSWGGESSVRLETASRGADVGPRQIEILSRTGLDLNPLDPADGDDRLWLEALVWPEHRDRRARLQAALDLAVADPPLLLAGDALKTLGPVIDELPKGDPVVVINSFVLNQLPQGDRDRYVGILEDRRDRRAVYQVSLEWLDVEADAAELVVDEGSGPLGVARAQPHGEWIEVYARP